MKMRRLRSGVRRIAIIITLFAGAYTAAESLVDGDLAQAAAPSAVTTPTSIFTLRKDTRLPFEILNNTPQSLPFFQDWTNTNLITIPDDWSAVPGIEGYVMQNPAVATTGVDPRTILGDSFGAGATTISLDVAPNQVVNPTVADGLVELHPDAQGNPFFFPTMGVRTSDSVDAAFLLLNINTTGRSGVEVKYAVFDIDCSERNAVHLVATQFRVGNTGNFTNVPNEFIPDVTQGPNFCTQVAIMGGNLPASVNNQPLVQIRMITTNAPGEDEWIALDLLEVTSTGTVTPTPTATPTPTPTPAPPSLSVNDVALNEGNFGLTAFTFTVTRNGPLDNASSASYETLGGSATTGGGPFPMPFADYLRAAGVVAFQPGQATATINVSVVADRRVEPAETFTLNIFNPIGATIGDGNGLGTILNDDIPSTPSVPISLIVNEVDAVNGGTDANEFIEVFGRLASGTAAGPVSLDGHVVVLYDGETNRTYQAFDLDGQQTNASGYFTIGSAGVSGVDLVIPGNTLQNGPDAVAVFLGDDTDFPAGSLVTTENLRDAIVYGTDDPDDPDLLTLLNPSQPQVNENANGNAAAVSMQRCPNGFGGERNTTPYRVELPTPDSFNTCPSLTFTITGRVFTPGGQGLRNAVVTLTDALGVRRTATTSSFGVYNFDNVRAGETITLSVSSKRYRFAPQILTVNQNLADVDFVGLE